MREIKLEIKSKAFKIFMTITMLYIVIILASIMVSGIPSIVGASIPDGSVANYWGTNALSGFTSAGLWLFIPLVMSMFLYDKNNLFNRVYGYKSKTLLLTILMGIVYLAIGYSIYIYISRISDTNVRTIEEHIFILKMKLFNDITTMLIVSLCSMLLLSKLQTRTVLSVGIVLFTLSMILIGFGVLSHISNREWGWSYQNMNKWIYSSNTGWTKKASIIIPWFTSGMKAFNLGNLFWQGNKLIKENIEYHLIDYVPYIWIIVLSSIIVLQKYITK